MSRHFFTAAALVGSAIAAAAADPVPKPPDVPTAPTPAAVPLKGTLPRDWKKLGLSDLQKQKAYSITADAKAKLVKLEAEIAAVKDDEHMQLNALLTDEQRTHLTKLLTGDKADSKK